MKNRCPRHVRQLLTSLGNGWWDNVLVSTKYVHTDTRLHKKGFLIGLSTVILVVWFISLLYNVIEKSPIVFLKLAEDSVAEIDMVSRHSEIIPIT